MSQKGRRGPSVSRNNRNLGKRELLEIRNVSINDSAEEGCITCGARIDLLRTRRRRRYPLWIRCFRWLLFDENGIIVALAVIKIILSRSGDLQCTLYGAANRIRSRPYMRRVYRLLFLSGASVD